MENTNDIGQTIHDVIYDIKAEAVIADLLENGLAGEDFVVIPNGIFRRRYSHDIAYTSKIHLKNGSELVGINLNRDAIYDNLPEGFFHQNTEHSNESKNVSKNSKHLKEEEKAARRFFLPFENEIYSQSINLELEERKILNHFSESLSEDFSPEFWRMDQSIDQGFLVRMVKFLHISYKIAGNTKLTEECLEAIINEHVKVSIAENCKLVKVKQKDGKKKYHCLLGSAMLGVDFICGNEFMGMGYTMQFDIGPLMNSGINDYLKNGRILNFLKCFFGYFVPVEFDISTKIHISAEKQGFTLEPAGEGAVLGYKTAV